MAKLGNPVLLPIQQNREDFKRYLDRTRRYAVERFGHRAIRFPVADGYACYYVTDNFTLCPIEVEDGYSVHPALIRGLRRSEIQDMLDDEARWAGRNA